MKNLDFALRALFNVKSRVVFSVVGSKEDKEYFDYCQSIARDVPKNVDVIWSDAIEHSQIAGVMASNDFLFVPTRGENFGHVILESLSVGTPVLISDRTPWRGLEQLGVGYDLPLNDWDVFAKRIEEISSLDTTTMQLMRARAIEYANHHELLKDAIAAQRAMFLRALADGPSALHVEGSAGVAS